MHAHVPTDFRPGSALLKKTNWFMPGQTGCTVFLLRCLEAAFSLLLTKGHRIVLAVWPPPHSRVMAGATPGDELGKQGRHSRLPPRYSGEETSKRVTANVLLASYVFCARSLGRLKEGSVGVQPPPPPLAYTAAILSCQRMSGLVLFNVLAILTRFVSLFLSFFVIYSALVLR